MTIYTNKKSWFCKQEGSLGYVQGAISRILFLLIWIDKQDNTISLSLKKKKKTTWYDPSNHYKFLEEEV